MGKNLLLPIWHITYWYIISVVNVLLSTVYSVFVHASGLIKLVSFSFKLLHGHVHVHVSGYSNWSIFRLVFSQINCDSIHVVVLQMKLARLLDRLAFYHNECAIINKIFCISEEAAEEAHKKAIDNINEAIALFTEVGSMYHLY